MKGVPGVELGQSQGEGVVCYQGVAAVPQHLAHICDFITEFNPRDPCEVRCISTIVETTPRVVSVVALQWLSAGLSFLVSDHILINCVFCFHDSKAMQIDRVEFIYYFTYFSTVVPSNS